MILVTVGSTQFEALIREVDRLVGNGTIVDDVVCQIGTGKYEPVHCKFFRFKRSISEDLDAADLVISHGGNTVFEAIAQRKPLIAVANIELADDHQTTMLSAVAEQIPILWTRDPSELGNLISMANQAYSNDFHVDLLSEDINEYLDAN